MADLALVWDSGRADFLKKLGNVIQYFQVNCPVNAHGLPLKLIDPTVLAPEMVHYEDTDSIPDDIVEQATLDVEYVEGFPTVDGLPIWERLDGELIEYYKLFKEYREMKTTSGARSIAKLSASSNVPGRALTQLAKVYHWQLRCRAFDHYEEYIRTVRRQLSIDKLETVHSKNADFLMEQAMTWLEKHPDQLNPKVAVQMIQLGMRAGRLALGLHPDRPGTGSEDGRGPTINIQQNNATDQGTINAPSINVQNATMDDMDHLQSVLHILSQSGAFNQTQDSPNEEPIDIEAEVVDG